MREIRRRISAAFAALTKPKQERAEGQTQEGEDAAPHGHQASSRAHPTMRMDHGAHGSVQVGHAGGPVTIVNVTQHLDASVRATSPRARPVATDAQRDVLRLMRGLPDQAVVEDFMHREFGTRKVIDLEHPQLYRVRRYVEAISRRAEGHDGRNSTVDKS